MVRRRNNSPRPAELVARGSWPSGQLAKGAPIEARYAQEIAKNLDRALTGLRVRDVAEAAGLSYSTIYDLLKGATYGEVITIARLEQVLEAPLWPSQERTRPVRG